MAGRKRYRNQEVRRRELPSDSEVLEAVVDNEFGVPKVEAVRGSVVYCHDHGIMGFTKSHTTAMEQANDHKNLHRKMKSKAEEILQKSQDNRTAGNPGFVVPETSSEEAVERVYCDYVFPDLDASHHCKWGPDHPVEMQHRCVCKKAH